MAAVKSEINSQVYTIADITRLLHLGETTVRKLVFSRNFPIMKIGRQYRIPKKEFDRWFEQNMDKEIYM